MSATTAKDISAREFVLVRTIDAPRELVFKAWTDPKMIAQWWGPHGFTNPVCDADVRPGGKYRVVMRGPDGVEYPLTGIFHEIEPPSRIVMSDDCAEHPAEWQEAVLKDLPAGSTAEVLEAVNTITFQEKNGKTLLTLRTLFKTAAVHDAMVKMGMEEGWSQSLEKLEALLKAA